MSDLTALRTYYSDSTISRVRSPHFGKLVWLIGLPWRGNERNISCIPEGKYAYRVAHSPRAGRPVIWIDDVPGRSNIQIHPGNELSEIDGCELPCWQLGSDSQHRPRAQAPSVQALDYILDNIPQTGTIRITEASKPVGIYKED